jgi:hypothetical protein
MTLRWRGLDFEPSAALGNDPDAQVLKVRRLAAGGGSLERTRLGNVNRPRRELGFDFGGFWDVSGS